MAPTVDSPRSPRKPSQSMLGALLSTAASALKSPPYVSGSDGTARPLDPAHEEVYTRSLLFPDQNTISKFQDPIYPLHVDPSAQGQAVVGASDSLGRIDLQSSRDIRILIAQGSTVTHPKVVLFDSKSTALPLTSQQRRPNGYLDRSSPPSPSQAAPSRQAQRREEPSDVPSSSDLASDGGPPSILSGAFERSRRRDPRMVQTLETNEKALTNEPVADMRLFLDCMFGHTPLSYRGDTTKLHVFPNDDKASTRPSHTSPVTREGSGSWGRAEGRRKSQLSRSFTPSDLSTGDLSTLPTSNQMAKGSDKRTVLLTRTFSVSLSDILESSLEENERKERAAPQSSTTDISMDDGQRRAPMYGVALILQIPVSAQAQTTSDVDSGSRAGSLGSKDPYSSSYEHETRSGWLFLDPANGLTSSSASSIYSSDVDDFVDIITQRFDLVTRALSTIQSAVTPKLRKLLQQTTPSFSQHLPPTYKTQTRHLDEQRRLAGGPERQLVKTPRHRTVLLPAGALMADEDVKRVAESTARRFATGLRIPRVVTGQGRWGTWRDEARWIERWGGRKEQNFFFFQLLTAFLGNHTEWLNAIGPSWYRRRHEQLQTSGFGDDCAITSRTVIVGNNKLAARRLVFLLTSFLPATSTSLDWSNFGGGGRPTSSASYPHPTTMASVSRRGSLRRTLNRRAGLRRSDSENDDIGEGEGVPTRREEDMLINVEGYISTGSSETQSVKTAGLPIPQGNASTRKSSATTIATITPATTTPHFTSHRADKSIGSNSEEAPNISGSLASLNLIHTLKRNDSTEHSHTSSDSQPTSRWGSLISGFWSNRRDSTDDSDYTIPPDEALTTTSSRQRRNSRRQSGGKLSQMVRQGEHQNDTERLSPRSHYQPHPCGLAHGEAASGEDDLLNKEITQQALVPDSPLKLSVDEKDGVVDVEVPLPNFFSSCGSPGHSPATSGFMSAASFEETSSGYSQLSPFPYQKLDVSTPVNVAGWLKRYHPDFSVQAVSRYPQLESDIKQSMRGEPTPARSFIIHIDEKAKEKWVNVCSTLIADTETFTVKRLRLFRRAKPFLRERPQSSDEHGDSRKSRPSSDRERLGSESTSGSAEAEEYFTEESVFGIDNTLIDAIEHIMAQSNYTNNPPSAVASRPGSRQRSRANTGVSTVTRLEDVVPIEECERIILGALDQVVRSVVLEKSQDGDGNTSQYPRDRASTVEPRVQGAESSLREGIRKWLYDIEVVH